MQIALNPRALLLESMGGWDDAIAAFRGEDFPGSASVYDVRTNMPQPGVEGLAWAYVAIDSENAEAVSMNIFRHEGKLLVRNVELGGA